MKKYIVIPARFASTRFPAKPLFQIKGHSLLSWVLLRVKKLSPEYTILVATDHMDIFSEAQKMNILAIMTDSDLASGTDRIAQALERSQFKLEDNDLVFNIQGDEPLIETKWIENMTQIMTTQSEKNEKPPQMSTLAHSIQSKEELENLNSVKVILNQKNEAIYFSRFAIPHSRSEKMGIVALKHIGVYGYTYQFLKKFCFSPVSLLEQAESLEQLRALDMGAKITVLQVEKGTQGVDVPEDVIKIEKLLNWNE